MPDRLKSIRTTQGLLVGLGILQALLAFRYLPPLENFQDPSAARIVVFHVPMAWIATLGFIVSAVYAGRYLKREQRADDSASAAASEIGLLCCALATVTGSIFARAQWGTWWNWDPRETSIFCLLLMYAAYFALRSSVEDQRRRSVFCAVYALIACLVMPFLVFVVPRVYTSLHPAEAHLAPSYWLVLLISTVGFLIFFKPLFQLRVSSQQDDEPIRRQDVLRPELRA